MGSFKDEPGVGWDAHYFISFCFFRQDEPSRRAISKGTFVPNVPNFFLADKYFRSLPDKGMAQRTERKKSSRPEADAHRAKNGTQKAEKICSP